jgi:hypothetical protein
MTAEHGDEPTPERVATRPGKAVPDAAHLDEDAEALEDPVHAGDAIHQHEQHELDEQHELHRPPRPWAG